MWYALKVYSKDLWVRYLFLTGFILQGVVWAEVLYNLRYLNKEVTFILHTTIIAGANLSGEWWNIYFFPLIGSGIWLVNGAVGFWFFRKEPLLARMVAGGTIVFEILLLVLTQSILRINT